jgi:hypothetical protein
MKIPIRIWRSPYSKFGHLLKNPDDLLDETVTAIDAYDDKALQEIAESGFNAIWVHGLLKNIILSEIFPEFGRNSSVHIHHMRMLIKRAAKYNIKVFLYMQPPRALDVENSFWKKHPDVVGQETDYTTDDGYPVKMRSLCTSTTKVKDYLYQSSAKLANELPGLGGVILITASEFPSHCYGRSGSICDESGNLTQRKIDCPNCSKRPPSEVISEIIHLIRNGLKSVDDELKIVAWNWSWSSHYAIPCEEIISQLPKDIILMVDFERGGEKEIFGKKRLIDEYSLSYSGPSSQFLRTCDFAKKKRMNIMARLQIGTTHELATVPNLPLIGNLYDKAKAMKENGIADFMGCWNFGNMISANTNAFNHFMGAEQLPDKQHDLGDFAREYFPECNSELIVKAWKAFDHAMNSYPFSTSFLYCSPLNYTLIYPLEPAPVDNIPSGRSWLMDDRGGNLDKSLTEFSIEEVLKGLEMLYQQWWKGVMFLEQGLDISKCKHSYEELNNAQVCYHIFRSAWNTYRTYQLRCEFSNLKLSEYLQVINNELANLKKVLPIIKNNKRFGYHSEAQNYMFDYAGVKNKADDLEKQIQQLKAE